MKIRGNPAFAYEALYAYILIVLGLIYLAYHAIY